MTMQGRTLGAAAIVVALLAASCGSGGDDVLAAATTSTTTTSEEPQTESTDSTEPAPLTSTAPSSNEYVTDMARFLENLNEQLLTLNEQANDDSVEGPAQITVIGQLIRDTAALVDQTLATLPALPDDAELVDAHGTLFAALTNWRDIANVSADTTFAEVDALTEGWEERESVDGLAELHRPVLEAERDYRDACLTVAEVTVEKEGISINCLGQPDPGAFGPSTEPTGQIGGIDVIIADGAPIAVEQINETWVSIVASPSVDRPFWFDLSSEPAFADPSGDLGLYELGSAMGWPDDIPAWIGDLSGTVVGEGSVFIGEIETQYWDVVGDEERLRAISAEDPFLVVVDLDGTEGSDGAIQLGSEFIIRMYRIEVGDESILGLSVGVDPSSPAAEELPPFIPRAPEMWDWLDTVALPNLTLQ